ncbi:MAG: serine hydrolase domain-containing protein [Erysipelotrichaceae bacterium]
MSEYSLNQKNWKNLEQFLKQGVISKGFPGANFALIFPNETHFLSVGNKQIIPAVEKNKLDTIWDIASLSKVVVTTSCILRLVEDGRISLNTKISEILTWFPLKEVSVKHCLNHSSGINSDIVGYKQMSYDEMMESLKTLVYHHEIDTKVFYSDVNFILLGLLIDQITESLETYAHENIFNPLDMKDTGYNLKSFPIKRFAAYENTAERGVVRGVVHDGKAYKMGGVSGHAGVFSTIQDLSHFVTMVLNNGVYNGKQVLHPCSIELLKKGTTANLNEKRSVGWVISDDNYALGDYYSEHTLFHTGFSGGSMLIDCDKGVGFICLTNRVHPSRDNKAILTLRNKIHNLAYQCIE